VVKLLLTKQEGQWTTPKNSKTFNFELNQVKESHIGIIFRKNRALYEYKDLKLAKKKKSKKVLSIDISDLSIKNCQKK
jgi:hypothetical protein